MKKGDLRLQRFLSAGWLGAKTAKCALGVSDFADTYAILISPGLDFFMHLMAEKGEAMEIRGEGRLQTLVQLWP